MSEAPRGGVINRLETALYALYGVGAHSLKTQKQGKGAGMNQEEIQYWLSKKRWTPVTASLLLLDIDPRSSKGQEFLDRHNSPWEYPLEGLELEGIDRVLYESMESLINHLTQEINQETYNREGDSWGEKYPRYYLNGFKVLNPYKQYHPLDLAFPLEAFEPFAREEVFDGLSVDVPIFGLFLETDRSNVRTHTTNFPPAPIEQRAEVKDMEIVSGITVNQIKRFIDSKSDDYRPRLDVLIRVLIQLAGKPEGTISYLAALNTQCEALLKSQGIGTKINETAPIEVAKGDMDAIKRILSKNKATKGGRPPKDQE